MLGQCLTLISFFLRVDNLVAKKSQPPPQKKKIPAGQCSLSTYNIHSMLKKALKYILDTFITVYHTS